MVVVVGAGGSGGRGGGMVVVVVVVLVVVGTRGRFVDEVDTPLVVCKVDIIDLHPLHLVRLLLQHKDVVVEVLLQTLVGVVNAKLLEAVYGEALETKNI